MSSTIVTVPTTPFAGQKPGTSGLRKKVTEVQQSHYLENFVHCIYSALPPSEVRGATIVVSGDGRYYNTQAIDVIIRMSSAHGVACVILGQHGLMSTPCVSAVIRERKAYGGIILTASHNPGGPTEDFGIKYNCSNGGPAPEHLTDKMFELSKQIKEYKIDTAPLTVDLSHLGTYSYQHMTIQVIDAAQAYVSLMKKIFDFPALSRFVQRKDFTFVYDAMNGAGGPFGKALFEGELGAREGTCVNCQPKEDFAGCHPDPNLTYADELVRRMGLSSASSSSHSHSSSSSSSSSSLSIPDFGAASDGDADRNMILGSRFFVTPSDSVAIIAANSRFIPYFSSGLRGVARSMPTSCALDRVASSLSISCFEVPTGWKFFGNLMDAGRLQLCGEESFGTGSDHIREKDGLWAILAWLSILEGKNRERAEGSGLVTVKDIVEEHWRKFGRNYYSRYDYEGVDTKDADKVMGGLLALVRECSEKKEDKGKWGEYTLAAADEFTYTDPVDSSVSAHQGIRFMFTDGSRIVYRLSGTGSVGATIRVYIEKYENQPDKLAQETADALKPLIQIALNISKMKEYTGREKPTVIT